MDRLNILHNKVKNGVLKIQKKKIKDKVLKKSKPKDYERENICHNARKKAHTAVADIKREISNKVRENTTLTESLGLDFIEEGYGYSDLDVTIFEEPVSTPLSEGLESNVKTHYKALGVAEGVFAPIGAMSRNNRRYDDDHWEVVLENQHLKDKIANRGMLGTIGHHNKKVDDQDLAEGLVSHIVTDLKVCEDKNGMPCLYGKLEILNTPKGQLLKEYYEMGIPLYVSSRGGGRLLPVASESWKRVDKTNYYLETFDIVLEPGFLQAKPQYMHESLEDNKNITEGKAEEGKMAEKEPIVSTKMTMDDIVDNMLTLEQKLDKLTDVVESMTEVFEAKAEKEITEEKDCEEKEEKKEEAKDEKEITEEKDCEEKEDEDEKEAEKEITEEKDCEEKEEKKEEAKAEKEITEEKDCEEKEDEEHDKKEDKECHVAEAKDEKEDKECDKKDCNEEEEEDELEDELEESIDYKSEYEKSEAIVESLMSLVEKSSKNHKELLEKLSTVEKELNSYKLSEEFNITIDEAKEKLSEKSYDELREELKSAIEESKEAEAKETTEKIAESKADIIAESKHVRVRRAKVYSAFND